MRNSYTPGLIDGGAVTFTWELRPPVRGTELAPDNCALSICAEQWNPAHTMSVCGGQCVAELGAHFPDDVVVQAIVATHARWHLNNMRAGTPAQMAIVGDMPYEEACEALEAAGMLEDRGHRYGSAWLTEPLPVDVFDLVRAGFNAPDDAPIPDPIADAGITIESAFVPWSRSRNRGDDHRSLNWRVTVLVRGEVATVVDYSAGMAHGYACNKYRGDRYLQRAGERIESEGGCEAHRQGHSDSFRAGKPLYPDLRDVVNCLMLDAECLDMSFSEWCDNLGLDSDSRKALDIYTSARGQSIALADALGQTRFEALREACA